ncbi:MAG: alpha/beta hydrolase [Bacteroidetes bacterium]|nr:alpha/beta hydrolase [Bacteroidota bacterium]
MRKIAFVHTLFLLCFSTLAIGQKVLSPGDHFVNLNGIKLHYYVSGKGPVCLVPTPGWGPSINYLKNSLTPLEKYFTIVYYDTRVSGKSTGPAEVSKYTSAYFMNDMDSLRAYLKQPKVWILGHSMGGFQVLNYGIHHSNRLNGIIALSPLAGRDSLYEAEFTKMVMKRKGQPFFEKGSKIFMGKDTTRYGTTELMQYIMPFYFHDVNKIADFEKLGNPEINDKAAEYTDAAMFGTEYLFPELPKIKVPTLVIVGDDDFVCDKISQADRIHKQIPSSDEIVIKDAGHFSWVEQPTQFFGETEKWLKKQKLTAQK